MLYTPHFLIGAAIIKYIPNPWIGLPAALISHVVLDLIPHWDFDIEPGMSFGEIIHHNPRRRNILLTAMSIDVFLMGISFFWLYFAFADPLKLISGGLAAISPDVFEQGLLLLGKPLSGFQDKFQFRVSAKYGMWSYPIVSFIALYLLAK